jgi:two-component system, NarL family, invasion response regulator UvrY
MYRVIIVDDHPIVRRGLRDLIEETGDMEVAGDTGFAAEAAELVKKEKPDLVLLDISLPDMNGLELLTHLKSAHPSLPVLMLSIHPEEQYAIKSLQSGASGYLTKLSAPAELIEAIRKISRGEKYVSQAIVEGLVGGRLGQPLHEKLSRRELQVFSMIASGRTSKEIAQELAISVKTVSTYKARILEKMKMSNNAQLMHYAIANTLSGR